MFMVNIKKIILFLSLSRDQKNKIKIFGWKNKRCWLHVEDFCSALNRVINSKKCKNKIINIGITRKVCL